MDRVLCSGMIVTACLVVSLSASGVCMLHSQLSLRCKWKALFNKPLCSTIFRNLVESFDEVRYLNCVKPPYYNLLDLISMKKLQIKLTKHYNTILNSSQG